MKITNSINYYNKNKNISACNYNKSKKIIVIYNKAYNYITTAIYEIAYSIEYLGFSINLTKFFICFNRLPSFRLVTRPAWIGHPSFGLRSSLVVPQALAVQTRQHTVLLLSWLSG